MNKITLELDSVSVDNINISVENNKVINQNWEKLNSLRNNLFNSKLLRPISINGISIENFFKNENGVKISCDALIKFKEDIDYKAIVSMRYLDGDNNRILEKADIFYSLSCYIFAKTLDNRIVAMRRNSGDWVEAFDLPGGFIQAKHNIKDVAEFAKIRASEDLKIDRDSINDCTPLGIYKNDSILEIVIVYRVNLNLNFNDLLEKNSGNLFSISEGYSIHNHSLFFDIKIHTPLKPILECFVDESFKGNNENYTSNNPILGDRSSILPFSEA